MQYQIALSPDLGISPDDFAAAWNESEEAHNAATINLTRAKGVSYFDPVKTAIIISTVSTIGLGVVTNAIYDVLKAALIKKGKPEKIHENTKITQLDLPGGTRLVTVEVRSIPSTGLREAFEKSWKRNEAGYRYLENR